MVSLGNHFGSSFLSEQVDRQLTPGAVIYIHCPFTTPPKQKYLLVACCDPELLVLVINSEINEFINIRPTLLACQVDVLKDDHDFLEHDSIVNCVETRTAFNLSDIREAINADYGGVYKGRLRNYCIRNVISAVSDSPLMETRHINWITAALNSVAQ